MQRIPQRPGRGYLEALNALHGDQDRAARKHFDSLTYVEKVEAICTLADNGMGDYDIAHATKLSVEQIRTILGQRREARQ